MNEETMKSNLVDLISAVLASSACRVLSTVGAFRFRRPCTFHWSSTRILSMPVNLGNLTDLAELHKVAVLIKKQILLCQNDECFHD